MTVRVYLPTTLRALAGFVSAGEIPEHVEKVVAEGPDEESEYAALMSAADASTALLEGPGRRVVVVAELPDATGPVPLDDVVAVHADTEDRAAGADPDEDLAWFATQEIGHLISD